MDEHLYTLKELCDYLNLSESTIRRYVKNFTIPHFRLGEELRFSRRHIDQWLEQRHIKPLF